MSANLAPNLESTESDGVNIVGVFSTLAPTRKRARAKSIRAAQVKGIRDPAIQNVEKLEGEGQFGLGMYEVTVKGLR